MTRSEEIIKNMLEIQGICISCGRRSPNLNEWGVCVTCENKKGW